MREGEGKKGLERLLGGVGEASGGEFRVRGRVSRARSRKKTRERPKYPSKAKGTNVPGGNDRGKARNEAFTKVWPRRSRPNEVLSASAVFGQGRDSVDGASGLRWGRWPASLASFGAARVNLWLWGG